MLHPMNVTIVFMIYADLCTFSTGAKQELEFNIFAKTGAGEEFFGVGLTFRNSYSCYFWLKASLKQKHSAFQCHFFHHYSSDFSN